MASRKGSAGGFLFGMFVGVILGLAVALAVAFYLNKTPIPFLSAKPKAARSAEKSSGKGLTMETA